MRRFRLSTLILFAFPLFLAGSSQVTPLMAGADTSARTVPPPQRAPTLRPPVAAPQIRVTAPGSGAVIPLDGKVIQVVFSQSGFDINDNGRIHFVVELLKNGSTLGVVGNPNVPVGLNLSQAQQVYGAAAGSYLVLPSLTQGQAAPGPGYQYQVTAFKGTWQQSPTVLAKGMSGRFSFGPQATPAGSPKLVVSAPGAGAAIPLDGKVIQVVFSHSGFDSNDNGQIHYAVELVKGGATLGVVGNPNVPVQLNLNLAQQVYGATAGSYIVLPAFTQGLAGPGPGYQYRVTAFKGTWQQSPTVLAKGLSGMFSFGPQATPTGSPTLAVSAPAAGATVPLDGKVLQVVFSQSGFDIYDNGQIHYVVELVKNGVTLGVVGNPNVPIGLNLNQVQQVYGATAGSYIVLPAFTTGLAAPGPGYQYRVTAFKGTWQQNPTVLAKGLSGMFSFGPQATPVGTPKLVVSAPGAGAVIPLDGKVIQVVFSQSGFDIYDNGQIHYIVELVKNGVTLGVVGNPNVPVQLNLNLAQQVYGATAGSYIVLPAFTEGLAAPGPAYQYRVTAFKGTWQQSPTVLAKGLSGMFSFGTLP